MALDSTHYTTLAAMQSRAGIGDTADDTELEAAVKTASRAIDNWCGQFFYKLETATARTYTPVDGCTVWTDPFHTTTDLVVEIDSGDNAGYATAFDSTDYELERFGGSMAYVLHPDGTPYDTVLAVGPYWFPTTNTRSKSVRVTAQWGWDSVPDPVTEACKILAADLWKRKDTPFGIATGTVEFGGLRIGKDLMAQVASLIGVYRRGDRAIHGIG